MTAGARAHEAHFKCCCFIFMVYVIFICCTKEPTYNEEHYELATCNRVSNNVWRSIFKEEEGSCMGNRQKNKWNVWWIQTWWQMPLEACPRVAQIDGCNVCIGFYIAKVWELTKI